MAKDIEWKAKKLPTAEALKRIKSIRENVVIENEELQSCINFLWMFTKQVEALHAQHESQVPALFKKESS